MPKSFNFTHIIDNINMIFTGFVMSNNISFDFPLSYQNIINEKLIQDTKGIKRNCKYQAMSRLKKPFKDVITALHKDFNIDYLFEKRTQLIRISNKPDLIKINKKKLLKHDDTIIQKLAEQLPD